MKLSVLFLVLILSASTSFAVLAQRSLSADATVTPVESIELPPMEVLGEKQELALRMVRSALDRGRVYGYEGREQLYCWYERATGSHLIYLYCAKNKWINKAAIFGASFGSIGTPSYRWHIYRSHFPVNPLQMERRLARLGPTTVNDEIVTRARRGEPMPDNVPSKAEIDRFAAALSDIKAIRVSDATDPEAEATLISVIEKNGLTVDRYNHISKLVEQYSSLRKMVQDRL